MTRVDDGLAIPMLIRLWMMPVIMVKFITSFSLIHISSVDERRQFPHIGLNVSSRGGLTIIDGETV